MSDASRPPTTSLVAFDATSLARAVGGRVVSGSTRPIAGAAVDSRRIHPGNAFFALPGERTDGHRFLLPAAEAGASTVVVTRAPAAHVARELAARDVAVILVGDALAALHAAAGSWRERFSPLVVGVTGSLAKTSTKEQIAEVLAERWTVLRNEANENNEIGLPLTILRLGPQHEVAVLEMGMYVPGEIAVLARLARPSVGVVTAVRGTHLSRAGSIEAIEAGKRELVEALPPGGTAVLNADDPRVAAMASVAPAGTRVLTYGFSASADVTADEVTSRAEEGMSFTLVAGERREHVDSPALGRHGVHNGLAAAAVGIAVGLDSQTIASGLGRPFGVPHRSTLLDAGPWRILDDTYNAAPDSMVVALDLLATLPGRRVAVLGEMLELGDTAADAHRRVGRYAAERADLVIAVGPTASDYAAGAREVGRSAGSVTEAPDLDAAFVALLGRLQPGDVVLLKGSRGAALDVLVDRLLRAAGTGAPA